MCSVIIIKQHRSVDSFLANCPVYREIFYLTHVALSKIINIQFQLLIKLVSISINRDENHMLSNSTTFQRLHL
jgi:hypothetical protein